MSYSSTGFRNPFGFALTPWVKRLLIANGVFFLLTFAFSGLTMYLAFTPAEVLKQPWTPLTYMFVHQRFFHLFFNMLGLFFFGPALEERWGPSEFIKFYVICGIGGAILSLLTPQYPIIGASAAVYGILLAYAMYWPDNPIYIWGIVPVKAKWLVAFFIGTSLFFAVSGSAPGVAHLAHLGGCAAAFLYLKSNWGPTQFGPRVPTVRKRSPAGVFSKEEMPAERTPGQPRSTRPKLDEDGETWDEIDRILDKISARGLSSLTEDEKQRLEAASRRHRSN